jgi:hypothetical protein
VALGVLLAVIVVPFLHPAVRRRFARVVRRERLEPDGAAEGT